MGNINFYDIAEIKSRCNCESYLEMEFGIKLEQHRCNAVWRGGDGKKNVEVNGDQFHDYVTEQTGGLFELVAISKFGFDIDCKNFNPKSDMLRFSQVQDYLGSKLGLNPVQMRKQIPEKRKLSPLEYKVKNGYVKKAEYRYVNLDGTVEFIVFRLEHPSDGKTFIQCKLDSHGEYEWNLKGVKRIPYNLKECSESDTVFIAEGEKDCDTLISMGIPATTNNGGAKNWDADFCQYFKDKDIVLLPDNDVPGREHAERIVRDFRGVCKSIKVLTVSSLQKGDVTDWMEKEGGARERLLQMVADAEPHRYSDDMLTMAKEANAEPFRNFTETTAFGKTECTPRHISEMIDDLHVRLLDAPYRCGGRLFDRDRDSGEIRYIDKEQALSAWISEKTNKNIEWEKGRGMVSKGEFYCAVYEKAKQYNAISYIRDIKERDDVFYACNELPPPTDGHTAFKTFCGFFCPANRPSEIIMMALFASGLAYTKGNNAPLFVIDAEQGQGTGKTVLVESASELYKVRDDCIAPIRKTIYDLEHNNESFMKELLTTPARNARYCLFDNITKTLKSEELAQLVTASTITGRPAYATNEEYRPNNLTYCCTMNGAECNTDIASRAVFIDLVAPEDGVKAYWKDEMTRFMHEHRMEILADIKDIILHCPKTEVLPRTRYPKFELEVIRAFCDDDSEFKSVQEFLLNRQEDSNRDNEVATMINEMLLKHIKETAVLDGNTAWFEFESQRIFIHSEVINSWFSDARSQNIIGERNVFRFIKSIAKKGKIKNVQPDIKRYPDRGGGVSGLMYTTKPDSRNRGVPRIIGYNPDKERIEEVTK